MSHSGFLCETQIIDQKYSHLAGEQTHFRATADGKGVKRLLNAIFTQARHLNIICFPSYYTPIFSTKVINTTTARARTTLFISTIGGKICALSNEYAFHYLFLFLHAISF